VSSAMDHSARRDPAEQDHNIKHHFEGSILSLANARSGKVKQSRLRPCKVAGFEVTSVAGFRVTTEDLFA
jgi:hypothetical protein